MLKLLILQFVHTQNFRTLFTIFESGFPKMNRYRFKSNSVLVRVRIQNYNYLFGF